MKLARKLTAALTLGAALIWAGSEVQREREERAALLADVSRDHRDLGLVLAAAIASAEKPPEEVLRELAPRRDGLTVTFLRGNEPRRATSEALTVTHLPVADRGVLELAETNDTSDHFVSAARRESVVALVVLVALFALLSNILGELLIGRRTRLLVERTRRIGRGDLRAEPVGPPRDELAELAAEIESMCAGLRVARDEVAQQSEERVRAVEQLRHADRLGTVGKLAAGIAHELGTPLNVVAGRAALAAQAPDIDEAKRHARAIREATDRMARLLRQLMSFARRSELKICVQPIAPVVERAVAFVEPLSRKHGVTVSVDNTAPKAIAAIDAAQIEQVLVNLLVNALQASDRGATVEIKISRADDEVHLAVRDRGIGIDEGDLSRVFDPFFTTKDVGEGTGLGLSVARGIVEEHRGDIGVESERGGGTTVTVKLPARRTQVVMENEACSTPTLM